MLAISELLQENGKRVKMSHSLLAPAPIPQKVSREKRVGKFLNISGIPILFYMDSLVENGLGICKSSEANFENEYLCIHLQFITDRDIYPEIFAEFLFLLAKA